MLKVGMYVDASNLYRKEGPSLNYDALKAFAARCGRSLVRASAYVTVDPENPKPVKGFISALRNKGFKVVEKEWVRNHEGRVKADMDMELAIDVLQQAQALDVVVLVSGDGDFVQLVRAVQNMGRRVECLAFADRVNKALIREADEFSRIEDLEDAFFEGVDDGSIQEDQEAQPGDIDHDPNGVG